ncbi:DNA adenine methylase [Sporolituus thermophilus]|nr:DNA adenine methylase [Sporolituus thermophilus]
MTNHDNLSLDDAKESKMQPLIKWPGGKAREFRYIEQLIPPFDRYIEPFFGGGAVYFRLEPQRALVNDISADLMQFYRFVRDGSERFATCLRTFALYWGRMAEFTAMLWPDAAAVYHQCRASALKPDALNPLIEAVLAKRRQLFRELFDSELFVDHTRFAAVLCVSLVDKLRRLLKLEVALGRPLSDGELYANLETGLRSGFYLHFRGLYNDAALGRPLPRNLAPEERAAYFYFIREYCYGAMFRYNHAGEFNIPYGGMAYNGKDFGKKINRLLAPATVRCLAGAELYNLDFADFLDAARPTDRDFVFLDPPYDSDFADYEGRTFTRADQRRLAERLYCLDAPFILIIKNTDYIRTLYTGRSNLTIVSFDKQYAYNVRRRNNRQAKHLIITNIV